MNSDFIKDQLESSNRILLAGMKAGQEIERRSARRWKPFEQPTSLTVRTLYYWHSDLCGDTFSQDPYLFSDPPLMQFTVPDPTKVPA